MPNPYVEFVAYWGRRGLTRDELTAKYKRAKMGLGYLIGPPFNLRFGDNLLAFHRRRKGIAGKKARDTRKPRKTRKPITPMQEIRDTPNKPKKVSAEMDKLRLMSKRKLSALRRFANRAGVRYRELKDLAKVVNVKMRPLEVSRSTMITGRLARKGCVRSYKKNNADGVFATIEGGGKNKFRLLFAGGKALGRGVYGITYATKTGIYTPSAMKIAAHTDENEKESIVGMHFAKAVRFEICPNMVATLGYMVCRERNVDEALGIKGKFLHQIRAAKGYVITAMELANGGTLNSYLAKRRVIRDTEFVSIVMQCLAAIRLVHSTGKTHSDNHSGNYLINTVDMKGSFWHYRLSHDDYYVLNHGVQVMLADFGWVLPYDVKPLRLPGGQSNGGAKQDLLRVFENVEDNVTDSATGICAHMIRKIRTNVKEVKKPYTQHADDCIFTFADKVKSVLGIDLFEEKPKGQLINGDPYSCQWKPPPA